MASPPVLCNATKRHPAGMPRLIPPATRGRPVFGPIAGPVPSTRTRPLRRPVSKVAIAVSPPSGSASSAGSQGGDSPAGPVSARYDMLVSSGAIERDPAQTHLVQALDRLVQDLDRRRRAKKGSALGWLFGRSGDSEGPPKGLYIWGSVGRGKTMLMDLFHEAAPGKKRRVHFHGFLSDAHERIHAHRQALKAGTAKGDDPIRWWPTPWRTRRRCCVSMSSP